MMATKRQICEKAVWGIKLNVCRIVSNISLSKNCFNAIASVEKVKIEIYCYHIADILTTILRKGLISGPPPSISF